MGMCISKKKEEGFCNLEAFPLEPVIHGSPCLRIWRYQVEEAVAFYRDVFGAEIMTLSTVHDTQDIDHNRSFGTLTTFNMRLGPEHHYPIYFQIEQTQTRNSVMHPHLWIYIHDNDTPEMFVQRAIAAGCTLISTGELRGRHFIKIKDPYDFIWCVAHFDAIPIILS